MLATNAITWRILSAGWGILFFPLVSSGFQMVTDDSLGLWNWSLIHLILHCRHGCRTFKMAAELTWLVVTFLQNLKPFVERQKLLQRLNQMCKFLKHH